MNYLYCDSCFLITFYQDGKLEYLSRYKEQFYISDTQINGELLKPSDLPFIVRKSLTIIEKDRAEIIEKTKEFITLYETLSYFDCLCMAYASIDDYCLATDDKALIKKCKINNIKTKTSKDIEIEFIINKK